ncbi:MAG: ABC transporter permease subunit [Chloroflexi bacterium]|nr:ABC transporter permease subunit [Chloroflexota bacterium]
MFNFSRVWTILDKEWAEVFKNHVVLFTVILMPLIFTLLPLGLLFFFGSNPAMQGGDSADVPAEFAAACGNGNLSTMDCVQVFLINEFMLLYMIMPIAIPIAIAAYSIVGEKATHSLEPLLATPITTEELLVGKGISAVIPAVAATWGCFLLFLFVSPLTGISKGVQAYIAGPTWLLAIFVISPLMAIMAVNFAIFVSSRTADPRVAEQVSAVLILPVIVVLFGQLAGFLILNVQLMLFTIAGLIAIDIAMVMLGARLFRRETILTGWK